MLLELDGVEAMRHEILADLGVSAEITQLEHDLAAARAGWDEHSRALSNRISELESILRGLLDATEQRFDAFEAQTNADKRWIDLLRGDPRLQFTRTDP